MQVTNFLWISIQIFLPWVVFVKISVYLVKGQCCCVKKCVSDQFDKKRLKNVEGQIGQKIVNMRIKIKTNEFEFTTFGFKSSKSGVYTYTPFYKTLSWPFS